MQNYNMKNLLKTLIFSSLFILLPFISHAQTELDEMTKEELLFSLALGKQAPLIKKFQEKEATRLLNNNYNPKKNGCNIETMRSGEVIIITIPTDLLFLPNERTLIDDCDNLLFPIQRYLKTPDFYRVLLVMHTDDTGSETYTDELSLDRVDAVFDWFETHNTNTTYLFPTASGASEPLFGTKNNTVKNRAKNRRLEIYLIPGEEMLRQAKLGRIAL